MPLLSRTINDLPFPSPEKGTTTDKQDIATYQPAKFLLRMLAATAAR